jgi:hypothetical protein
MVMRIMDEGSFLEASALVMASHYRWSTRRSRFSPRRSSRGCAATKGKKTFNREEHRVRKVKNQSNGIDSRKGARLPGGGQAPRTLRRYSILRTLRPFDGVYPEHCRRTQGMPLRLNPLDPNSPPLSFSPVEYQASTPRGRKYLL